jgi:hypothetical protein
LCTGLAPINKGKTTIMDIFKIIPNTSGKVRLNLALEDIVFPQEDVVTGFDLIMKEDYRGEKYVVFKEPFRMPRFNKFYGSRIKSAGDPYLVELIHRVLYLNPNPDYLLKKKIVEVILMRFTKLEIRESKVKMGEMIPLPVITFEEVAAVLGVVASKEYDFVPDNEDTIMFYRDSIIPKKEKIKLRAYYRANLVKKLLSSAIHTVAEHLIESQDEVKVSHTRIEDTKMVTTSKGPASVRTIRKYMSDRTLRIVDEHNDSAPFASDISKEKFYCYMGLPIETSLNEISESLQVSKSTATAFKKLRVNQRLPNVESLNVNVS